MGMRKHLREHWFGYLLFLAALGLVVYSKYLFRVDQPLLGSFNSALAVLACGLAYHRFSPKKIVRYSTRREW